MALFLGDKWCLCCLLSWILAFVCSKQYASSYDTKTETESRSSESYIFGTKIAIALSHELECASQFQEL